MEKNFKILVADESHFPYVEQIRQIIRTSAEERETGIAERTAPYLEQKMLEGKAVIALLGDQFVGFSYIETFENKQFVSTSGLVIAEEFRGQKVSWQIKQKTFQIARERYPEAKIFSITTGIAVMRMNEKLGYLCTPFPNLTSDEVFWRDCKGCRNYDILERSERRRCYCSGMMFNPADPLCIAKWKALRGL